MEKLFVLISIHLLALTSPGPDFLLVLRSSLSGKIKKTLICCAGIALAVSTHLAFAYFGLSLIISQSTTLYSMVVIVGCLWLIKTGTSVFLFKGEGFGDVKAVLFSSNLIAFRDGYLTNLLNPKALIYFVSVISPLVRPGQDNRLFLAVGIIFTIMTFLWFSLVAVLLNTKSVRSLFELYSNTIDKLFSVAILLLAFYMLYGEIRAISI